MLNYVKSEFYRITHSSALYALALGFAGAPLLANIILFCFGLSTPDYRYATTSFSYSNLVANPMLLCCGALFLVFTLYEGNKKNGTLKNVIASGISREKIFAGQIIVTLAASIFILATTAFVYVLSARLLLREEGPAGTADLLHGILAASPVAAASLILAITVVMLFDRSFLGIFLWFCIFYIIPKILFYIGMEVEPVGEIAKWMPSNFFGAMQVNQSVCAPIWDTAQGLSYCLFSGFAGIVIFGIAGILCLRKKEI